MNKDAFIKQMAAKHKKLNDEVINSQLSYYLALRDKKINYLKHIEKLMLKLEK